MLLWVVPIAMILFGLVLVSSGLSDADEPARRDVAPSNVTAIVVDNAAGWATSQVGADVATQVDDVVMVGAVATGASTYTARAVIVRTDSRIPAAAAAGMTVPTLADGDISTVATCVLWDVDVTGRTFTPRAALEIDRRTGRADLTDGDDGTESLRERCRGVAPPG